MIIYTKVGRPNLEKILECTEFYDMPRCGIACFLGTICYFEYVFDEEEDDYSQISLLRPIPEEIYEAIKEKNLAFLTALEKWQNQIDGGAFKLDPFKIDNFITDKVKYNKIEKKIKKWLHSERVDEFCSIGNIASWNEILEYPDKWNKDCCENPHNLEGGVFWDLFDHDNHRRAIAKNAYKSKLPL